MNKNKKLNDAFKIIDKAIEDAFGRKCDEFSLLCPTCETYWHWEWVKEALSIYLEEEG